MTTIATDGKVMAGDGRTTTANDVVIGDASPKVLRLSDGSLLGCSGSAGTKHRLADWLESEIRGEGKAFPKMIGPFSAILLTPSGEGRYYSEEVAPNWVEVTFPCATGSGCELAIGAMEAGADPAEAIRIAARRDPFTGGEITAEVL